MVQHSNVTVNFNVNVDASGNITVFGSGPDTPTNIIIAKALMPVNALYDANINAGLIEFWEPSSQLGDISVQLADSNVGDISFTGVYKTIAKNLAYGFQQVLCDEFDCSAAYPFAGNSKYTGQTNYTTNSDFGRFALSVYADALFGHAAATAAITNDTTFMQNMLSLNSDTYVKSDSASIASARYGDWSKSGMVDASDVLVWNAAQSSSDANLAVALTKAIIQKGILSDGSLAVSSVNSVTSSANKDTLAYIVKQVIGQDASRAMDQDNNVLAPEVHQLLRFYAGDKIYVQITLQKPLVTVAPSSTSYQKAYDAINALFTEGNSYKYALEITLGSSVGVAVPITITSATYDGSFLTFNYTSTVDFTSYGNSYFSLNYTTSNGINNFSNFITPFDLGSGQKSVPISETGIQSFVIITGDNVGQGGLVSNNFTNVVNNITSPISFQLSSYELYTGAPISTIEPSIYTTGTITTYSMNGSLPAGLSFDAATGFISGTPTATQATTIITYSATDTSGTQYSGSFDITVSTPPITIKSIEVTSDLSGYIITADVTSNISLYQLRTITSSNVWVLLSSAVLDINGNIASSLSIGNNQQFKMSRYADVSQIAIVLTGNYTIPASNLFTIPTTITNYNTYQRTITSVTNDGSNVSFTYDWNAIGRVRQPYNVELYNDGTWTRISSGLPLMGTAATGNIITFAGSYTFTAIRMIAASGIGIYRLQLSNTYTL